MNWKLALALAFALSLMTTACGGSGSQKLEEVDGVTKIRVGTTGLTVHAPLYIAEQKGWFEEAGLDVTLEVLSGGAAIIPAMLNGELHFGASNIPSALLAAQNGIDLRAVAANNVSADSVDDVEFLTSAVVAPQDGPIDTPADLQGATIAVNGLHSVGDLTISLAMRELGLDPNDVKFIELGLPEMIGALEAGRVDAAWVVEPFLGAAKAAGMSPVLYNWVEARPGLPIGAYYATADFATENAAVVDKFREVVDRATVYAAEHPEEVRSIVGMYTKVPEAAANAMALPVLVTSISRSGVVAIADEMLERGSLNSAPDYDSIFALIYDE
ncbi:ABC transporter substrate-binding protein [Nocardioides sp. AE5]|uniref:ABC transporter substrate-binding protein n=1 Tax=Nocardioides sp. AE5 TaxID=2962573 RepID=UPI002882ABA7|nr:ABC transporter substrate-binding protein [Nocardioides sp. AE5]MDT0201855.1 ABC transporter substrate-binding protein [Nocardioides sp. AE5]